MRKWCGIVGQQIYYDHKHTDSLTIVQLHFLKVLYPLVILPYSVASLLRLYLKNDPRRFQPHTAKSLRRNERGEKNDNKTGQNDFHIDPMLMIQNPAWEKA